MSRVVLLGLDGATFALLNPLLDAHRLPHLGRLRSEGAHGVLRSTLHPLTPAAWTSCVTGLNPGKHGIYDFRRRRAGSYELQPINARLRDGAPLWAILSEQGRRCGVFNVPMTYPPDPVDGFIVSGMDTPGIESPFVYPSGLRASLLAALPDYRIDLDESSGDEDAFLERVQALASVQQRALDYVLGQDANLDFLMAVFVATDRLYHVMWRYLDPTQPAYGGGRGAAVRAVHERIWAGIDDTVGKLRAWAGDGTIMIVSDHGFGPLHKDVYLNHFLEQAGLLVFRAGHEGAPFADAVDWRKTRAYSFGYFGNINLNLRGREPLGCVEQGREAEELKRALIATLATLRDPETHQPIVDSVLRREEVYSGPHVEDAPDLLLIMRDYAYMTRDGYESVRHGIVGPPMSLNSERPAHTGNHRLDGIFMIAGPGVRPGAEVGQATLLDVAPTVLYALGMPAPGMDGHVLRQAFADDYLAAHPPRRLLAPPQAVASGAQREVAVLAQQVSDLQGKVRRLEDEMRAAAGYAGQLEAAIGEKNAHVAGLEAAIEKREKTLGAFQRSVFYRAYRRWQRLFGK